MDQIAINAASGLQARMEALDMVGNNLANTTTGGFKLDREFYSLFTTGQDGALAEGDSGTKLPMIQKQWTDFSQGALQSTGNSLDLALSGKGFFAVDGPSGTLYTRNGSFQLSSSGVLITMDGYAVRAAGGQPIQTQTQSGSRIEVGSDGSVRQGEQTLGKLELADFENTSVLQKVGKSYFKSSDPQVNPGPAGASVEQGMTENSNVAPAESAVRLVNLMRQFEMLQKAIGVTTDMNKKALDEVARVGPSGG